MFDQTIEFLTSLWNWLMDNIFYVNIVFAVSIVFFERRDPKTVWTWLLVMYFIPLFGFLLYMVLGQNYHKVKMFKTKEIEDALNGAIKEQEDHIFRNEFELSDERIKAYSDLVLYNLQTSRAIYSDDNKVQIFRDGNDKFEDFIREIQNAKSFIHIQYYIIKSDELMDRISKELIKKARQGVEVRILYDGMGGRLFKRRDIRELKKYGIKVGVFFPAFLGRFQLRFNYRNHRKIAVIDGKCGYVGGFNIGKEYIGRDKKFGYWRDTHLKIQGMGVNDLQNRFILDWNYATKENLFKQDKYFDYSHKKKPGTTGMQIVSSGPDSKREEIRDNYLRLIQKAEKNIYIHTPYFIPDDAVLQALIIAAYSGVDVKLMIPSKPDHPFVYWVNNSFAGELLKSGAKVYTYEKGFLHAKGIMVDGMVSSYGTANMDMRSFSLNFEVNAVLYDMDLTKTLESQFLEDLSYCSELTRYNYDRRSVIVRFKEQISRLFAPLM